MPQGAGLGLRRAFLTELLELSTAVRPDFLEIAPENWMGMGGRYADTLSAVAERYPLVAHGLSLNLGGQAPLDTEFLTSLRRFLDRYRIPCYSEHLSFSADDGHLYDLLPIPFTEEAVRHVCDRIRQVEDILERPLVLENVSYYAAPGACMSESEFVGAILAGSDCGLLLDVNNVYVNSINHGYDPEAFIRALPTGRITYLHVAGHYVENPDLRIDTHGDQVVSEVWHLLDRTYAIHGPRPTLLERDFNLPPLAELLDEVQEIRLRQGQVR